MTVQRRSFDPRRLYALLIAATVLWLVGATAPGDGARAVLSSLTMRTDLALTLLRSQIGGDLGEDALPSMVTFAISQSPLLLSGRNSILELRRSEEIDEAPTHTPPKKESPTVPIIELPEEPETPLVIIDNGVAARTLVPTSPDGYIVSGDVYVDNRSDKPIPASLFSSSPTLALSPGEEPQVLIVHTHGSEAYTMPPGQEYIPCDDFRTTDPNCSVVRVGSEIAAVLEKAGIAVLHDTTLHDYPHYSGAYDRSLATVEQYLARYPSITLVLDIHRDAISDGNGNMYKIVSSVGGLNAAQMCFVVGTDGGGLSHPHWQENLKLAASLQQTLSGQYPTLMRPITVRNSRYNQHTCVGSLLVEMGAAGNSPDEAILSARLLADAIVQTLVASSGPSDHADSNG